MICTFFGHSDTPKEVEETLRTILIDLIEKNNVNMFYVGNNGNFDSMVLRQLVALSKIYPIKYCIVLSYMPYNKHGIDIDYRNTILPEDIENVPKRFAISYRNKWMIQQSDYVITYVIRNFGGAFQFKEKSKKMKRIIIELSDSAAT